MRAGWLSDFAQLEKHAIMCGQHLIKVKSKCRHGEFLSFFGASNTASNGIWNAVFGFSEDKAQKYIKAAKYPAQVRTFCRT